MMKNTFKNIDEYIMLFLEEVQEKLLQLRQTIHSQHPDIEEYIGYQMPAFRYKGKPLVYFAGYKKHIGFYPASDGIKNFEKDFIERNYKFSKGAVQLPLDEELPVELINTIIRFKISEIDQKNPEI
ncbi:uncharacterized protein YdhG (YjbR/CyaY superfamily) [Chryseobacterium defluvii]|uniref:Uncharacterized protein YdhG (YjbR/CyaY superfamily) n=1 Tax=Chryseobacterium defluvii TaxID=160396 RepID=A0A840KH07_9FLAO|nr:DUF1801 domain-containing protein [Chryseobacterium defluvii]MBB4806803.1 uncharacterized protein YdhG (YjbR/CyaY superfamily) [Chryseobacterium defluvii]